MPESCPSRFDLVLWRTGDLAQAGADRLLAHVADCSICREALESYDAAAAAWSEKRQQSLGRLHERLDSEPLVFNRSSRPSGRVIYLGVAALAAAVVVSLSIWLWQVPRDAEPTSPSVAYKGAGDIGFEVVAKRGARQFVVRAGDTLAEGDAVRFVVTAPSPLYLSVLSIDEQGRITPFYPDTNPLDDPRPLFFPRAGRRALEGSVILDGSLLAERFVVLFSAEPFDRREAHRLLTNGHNLEKTALLAGQVKLQMLKVYKSKQ